MSPRGSLVVGEVGNMVLWSGPLVGKPGVVKTWGNRGNLADVLQQVLRFPGAEVAPLLSNALDWVANVRTGPRRAVLPHRGGGVRVDGLCLGMTRAGGSWKLATLLTVGLITSGAPKTLEVRIASKSAAFLSKAFSGFPFSLRTGCK